MFKMIHLVKSLVIAAVVVSFNANAAEMSGKKVLFIDSYHEGYEWSDGITNGIKGRLGGTGVELKVVRMDTKRNKGEDFMKSAVQKMKSEIESFKPDVVIAADDNASKYLIQPFYRDASLPFVFCGVNWDEGVYGYPYKNVTGMVEVAGAKELVDLLKSFAKGDRVALLADDTLSSRKDAENYKNRLGINLTAHYASSFTQWKQMLSDIQSNADILIMGNVAGITDFDKNAGVAHVSANARIPSGAVQLGVMDYALVGYLKVAEEQGDWAAGSALKILAGTSPAAIPIARNKEGQIVVNMKLAEAANIEVPFSVIETASQIIE